MIATRTANDNNIKRSTQLKLVLYSYNEFGSGRVFIPLSCFWSRSEAWDGEAILEEWLRDEENPQNLRFIIRIRN